MTLRLDTNISKQVLADVVVGKDKSLPRSMAINALLSSGVPDSVDLLRKVLESDSEDPKIRRLAALALWRTNTGEALPILRKAAETIRPPSVLTAVVKCLGRVGDEDALKLILEIRQSAQGVLATQATFAASLISYRLGLEGNNLPIPTEHVEMPSSSQHRLRYTAPSNEELDLFMSCLAHEPYGIRTSKESAIECRGPGCNWVVGFNDEITRGNSIELLQHRKSLLAIVASKGSEDGRYTASYLVFTSPAERRKFNILINRTTGEPAWAGATIDTTNDQANFVIRTVGRIGIVPMELEGNMHANGRVVIKSAVIATRVSEKRHPHRLDIAPI